MAADFALLRLGSPAPLGPHRGAPLIARLSEDMAMLEAAP